MDLCNIKINIINVRTRDGNPSNFGIEFAFLQKSVKKNGLVHGLQILGILADCGFSVSVSN